MPLITDDPTHGHTLRDATTMRAAGGDPAATQPRNQSVPCRTCRRPTFHLAMGCDTHYVAPTVRRALEVAS